MRAAAISCILGCCLQMQIFGQCPEGWLPGREFSGIETGATTSATNPSALTWDPDGPGPRTQGLVIAGYGLVHAGRTPVAGVAFWDGETWSALGNVKFGSELTPLLFVFQDRLHIAGQIITAEGVAANNIVRWNGASWETLAGGVVGTGWTYGIRAIAEYQGKLVVAGIFTTAGGVVANGLAEWDGAMWSSFTKTQPDDIPFDIRVYDGALYAATFQGVYRWDGVAWQKILNSSSAYRLGIFGDELLAAGKLTIGGAPAATAAWDGGSWRQVPFDFRASGVDGTAVLSFTDYLGHLYMVGYGLPLAWRLGIQQWNGLEWKNISLGPPIGPAHAGLAKWDESLVALSFVNPNDHRGSLLGTYGIALWNGLEWSAFSAPSLNRSVQALCVSGSELYATGSFFLTESGVARAVARWTGSGWEPLPAQLRDRSSVACAVPFDTGIAVGGTLTAPDAAASKSIAFWNGSAWSSLGTGFDGPVQSLAIHADSLVAGGTFKNADGAPASAIATWSGNAWLPLAEGLSGGPATSVRAMVDHNHSLVVGGVFSVAGTQPATNIAVWDGQSWAPLAPYFDISVDSLLVHDGQLLAGGRITTQAGSPAAVVARWNGAAWEPIGDALSLSSDAASVTVAALAYHNNQLYIAGTFDRSGQTLLSNIARFDGAAWAPLDPEANDLTGSVTASGLGAASIASFGGTLFVGGSFHSAGGSPSFCVARFGSPIADCPAEFNCDGFIDAIDLDLFINAWVAADPSSDINFDGFSDAIDYDRFMETFFLGC